MSAGSRGVGWLVAETLRTALVVGGLFILIDLAQIAALNAGSLTWAGIGWLVAVYMVPSLLGAGVLVGLVWLVRRRDPEAGVAWVRALMFAGAGAILAQEVGLRMLSPLSPWRLWVVLGVAVLALLCVLPARRLLRRVPAWVGVLALLLFVAGSYQAVLGGTHKGGTATPAATVAAGANRPNVVLVLIDTLRADHLGAYGYERPTSPNIDAFAKESVLFTRAFSQSSWTKPAMASMLTSHYPSMHQTYLEQQKLPESEVLLTQLLHAQGYATAVFSGNPWITPDYGFDKGVDYFYSIYDERFARVTLVMTALKRVSKAMGDRQRVYNRVKKIIQGDLSTTARDEVISAEAFRWLDAHKDKPFYMHLHMMSPHHPYDPPPPYDKFVPDKSIPPMKAYPKKSYFFFEKGQAISKPQLDDMVARYDGDILFADMVFGKIIAKLKADGVLDNTIVIVVADHGEEFYDHENWGHGQSIYNELINVPLILRYPPALPGGTRVDQTVMSVDILPTVLDLVGAPPKPTAAGTSLVSLAKGAAETRAPQAYSELLYKYGQARGVIDDQQKLIEMSKGEESRRELYDLKTDFHEHDDLMSKDPALAKALEGRLTEVRDWAAKHQASASEAQIDDEMSKRLKALGYMN